MFMRFAYSFPRHIKQDALCVVAKNGSPEVRSSIIIFRKIEEYFETFFKT